MGLRDVQGKNEKPVGAAADLVIQGRDQIVRHRTSLLVAHTDRRVDADAVGPIVDDPEVALVLLQRSEGSNPEALTVLALGGTVRRLDHHFVLDLAGEIVPDEVRALRGRAVVARPLDGPELVPHMGRPTQLPCEDGRRAWEALPPAKRDA